MSGNNGETAKCENGERKNFPFEIKSVDPSIEQQLLKDFTGTRSHVIDCGNNLISSWPTTFRDFSFQLMKAHGVKNIHSTIWFAFKVLIIHSLCTNR